MSGPALGPIQSPIQWVRGIMWPKPEADHLPPSSNAHVKNSWSYSFVPLRAFVVWILIKHMGIFKSLSAMSHSISVGKFFPSTLRYNNK